MSEEAKQMNVKFYNNIVTHAPTCCLIEDYWMLQRALNHLSVGDLDEAREEIACAMECIREAINDCTEVPEGLEIAPSECSAIAMCCDNGIIMNGNKDLRCRAGENLSDAGGCHCETCPFAISNGGDECDPEHGYILLEKGVVYDATGDGEEFVNALVSI